MSPTYTHIYSYSSFKTPKPMSHPPEFCCFLMKPSPHLPPASLDPTGVSTFGSEGPFWARWGSHEGLLRGRANSSPPPRLRGKQRSGHCCQGDLHSNHLIRHPASSPHRSSTQKMEGVQVEALVSGKSTHPPDLFCINTKPSVLYLQKCLLPLSLTPFLFSSLYFL